MTTDKAWLKQKIEEAILSSNEVLDRWRYAHKGFPTYQEIRSMIISKIFNIIRQQVGWRDMRILSKANILVWMREDNPYKIKILTLETNGPKSGHWLIDRVQEIFAEIDYRKLEHSSSGSTPAVSTDSLNELSFKSIENIKF